MMTVRCYLAPSAIEGLGVFAAEPIAKGAVAWRLDPILDQTIPAEVLAGQPPHVREFLERYSYPHHELAGMLVLDADEGRFMNHADAPNLDFTDPELGIAVRDIAVGEELTCDYAAFTVGDIVHQPPRHRVHDIESAAAHLVAANGAR